MSVTQTVHGFVVAKEDPPERLKAQAVLMVPDGGTPWGHQSARRFAGGLAAHLGDQAWADPCSPAELAQGRVIRVKSKLPWQLFERSLDYALGKQTA